MFQRLRRIVASFGSQFRPDAVGFLARKGTLVLCGTALHFSRPPDTAGCWELSPIRKVRHTKTLTRPTLSVCKSLCAYLLIECAHVNGLLFVVSSFLTVLLEVFEYQSSIDRKKTALIDENTVL